MQFDSYQRETPTINISALIDVVFILLIFIVLAANFDRIREMNVSLPTAEEVEQPAEQALILTIPVDGPMLLNGDEIDDGDLADKLGARSEEFEVLVLVGDGDINLDKTVNIFDTAAAAGFESVSIATREEAQ